VFDFFDIHIVEVHVDWQSKCSTERELVAAANDSVDFAYLAGPIGMLGNLVGANHDHLTAVARIEAVPSKLLRRLHLHGIQFPDGSMPLFTNDPHFKERPGQLYKELMGREHVIQPPTPEVKPTPSRASQQSAVIWSAIMEALQGRHTDNFLDTSQFIGLKLSSPLRAETIGNAEIFKFLQQFTI
jgi:hypothetical protein